MINMKTLREKTREVRRHHILQAAAGVFAERGYHRATIRDVARAAGVSDGSIYNVFESKTALLLGLLDPLGAASRSVAPVPGEDGAAALLSAIRQRWDAFSPEMLEVLRPVLAEALVDGDLRHLFYERVLAPALGASTDKSTGDPETLRALAGAMMGLILLRLLGDEITTSHWDAFPDRLAEAFAPEPHRPAGADDLA